MPETPKPAVPDLEDAGLEEGADGAASAAGTGFGTRLPKRKRTAEEGAELRKRIFDLRMRGMLPSQIARVVGETTENVKYHLKKARLEHVEEVELGGRKEKCGEVMRHYQTLREEALRQMHKAEEGSAVRAVWFAEARKCVDKEIEFLMEVGLIPRASEKLEVLVRDVRGMSLAEINAEIEAIERRLASATVITDGQGQGRLGARAAGADAERVIELDNGVRVREADPARP